MSTPIELAEELTGILFAADPVRPSVLGLPAEHDRLADLSEEAEQRTRAACLDVAARAEAIDRDALSEQDRVTRDVVVQQAKAVVDRIDSAVCEISVSDAFGAPALQPLLLLPQLTLNDAEKARGYLARLAAFPSYLDTVARRQRAALENGVAPPEFLVDAGIAFVDRFLSESDTSPLRVGAETAGFAPERDRLLAEVVRPAYARYRDFLASEAKPRGRPADQAGLCWLPDGEERYAKLIRVHTTTDRTARDLHETGLALIEQLAGEYRELGGRVFGTTELAEIFHRLRTDPELRWSDGEELLAAARATITRAEAEAPRWFRSVPEQACEVQPVPEADAEGGTIAYYLEPALDGSRPGIYFANTFAAGERFRHTAEAIAFHEAVPGHHFQLSTALGLSELPLLRRIADINSYLEGWGLYAERLADEMRLYSGDVARFGLLTQDSMRAGRLVVDTGLHALGWSRQRAVDFLREHTPMAPLEIEREIDRYADWPGQALSYMVGRLEIQRIRAAAEEALGERFDIRDFHDVVLGNGVLPLSVLDTVVADWVARH
ncbi:DUF885 domain-containing protein [Amycolatopsis anabasis]|uniref:DUF885 domain-containing protein n=1 Tax=Amycolatopsis anabasis TaxID=1840409 RepID=UPI00131AB655|nr:DUF885 domain-containing protein [Amycolatopsis anabasis]